MKKSFNGVAYGILALPISAMLSFTPQQATAQTSFPVCASSASDVDGDGFGWENNRSCRVNGGSSNNTSSSSSNSGRFPNCASIASDPDNDGFGWENNRTCVVNIPSNNNSAPATATPSSSGNGRPICSDNSTDPDGDGYGFENGQSCLISNSQSNTQGNSNNSPVSVPPPVAAANAGTSNGRPICLTDASDVNNSGFGYENDRTCAVVNGVTGTRTNPLLNRRLCQDWIEIPYGNFRLQNNVWNESAVFTDNWSQCITLSGSRSRPVASWDYNWLSRTQGNEFSVKSYPQVYYGRKTRYNVSGTVAETGLPAPINNMPQFNIDFAYSETGNAERNVAFESFFHNSCQAEENNKQFELMVWVGKPEIRTPGPLVGTARISGRDWDVHVNPSLGWGYVAFVAQQPFTSGSLDWNAFVDWTRETGPGLGVPRVGNNTCMGAIELGTETFWGAGTFSIDRLNISYR